MSEDRDTDGRPWELDQASFELGKHVGEISAWCEAVAADVKPMSLSAPFPEHDHDILLPYVQRAADRNGVRFHLERKLYTTDLFGSIDLSGLWVFVIYRRQEVLDDYLAIQRDISRLINTQQYCGPARRELARRFGKLLGYGDAALDSRLSP